MASHETQRDYKTVQINASASGDTVVVPNPGGNVRIKVANYLFVAAAAVTARWYSGAAGSPISGPMAIGVNGGAAPNSAVAQLLATQPGQDLVLNLSGNVQVGGHLTYWTE